MIQIRNLHTTFIYISPATAGLFCQLLSTATIAFYLTLLNSFPTNYMVTSHMQQSDNDYKLAPETMLLNKMPRASDTHYHCQPYNLLMSCLFNILTAKPIN